MAQLLTSRGKVPECRESLPHLLWSSTSNFMFSFVIGDGSDKSVWAEMAWAADSTGEFPSNHGVCDCHSGPQAHHRICHWGYICGWELHVHSDICRLLVFQFSWWQLVMRCRFVNNVFEIVINGRWSIWKWYSKEATCLSWPSRTEIITQKPYSLNHCLTH